MLSTLHNIAAIFIGP